MTEASRNTSNEKEEEEDEEPTIVTFVEFYAGVGGWSMALAEAFEKCNNAVWNSNTSNKRHFRLERLAALDHSDLCLKVLQHNHHAASRRNSSSCTAGSSSGRTVSIERLSVQQVQEWNAHVWAMSPPCQPHTRQHENQKQDLDDPRSRSFLHLCSLLERMQDSTLPRLLLMENVVGFESSKSCQRWRSVLSKRNYKVAHFHLNPTQVGIPNDRPRYYTVAVLASSSRQQDIQQEQPQRSRFVATSAIGTSLLSNYFQLEKDVHASLPKIQTSIEELGVFSLMSHDESNNNTTMIRPISDFLDSTDVDMNQRQHSSRLKIPDKILDSQASWCFDIVTPHDRRSACFTQSYGKFVRGTGSVLYDDQHANDDDEDDASSRHDRFALMPPEEREFHPDWAKGLNLKENLRYFSGTEVARLFGFGNEFSFPRDCSLKQQWKLLGNSLNVTVAARLAQLGIQYSIMRY